jgi:hypothetical protein
LPLNAGIFVLFNRPTHDASLDTFRLDYLLAPVAVFALIFTYAYTPYELLWSFSIWLESVAILPQLFMMTRTGEAETITTHYLAALGLYRGLYIPNWIYRYGIEAKLFASTLLMCARLPRYFTEGAWDPIAVFAGIIQTALYADFGYIVGSLHTTRRGSRCLTAWFCAPTILPDSTSPKYYGERNSNCRLEDRHRVIIDRTA